MNFNELIAKTESKHHEFQLMMTEDLNAKLQQFALQHPELTRYEACTQVLSLMLQDSIGSMVETWIAD